MGWLDAIGSIFSWAENSSLLGSLVRVAAAFGLMRFINGLTNKNTTTTVPDNRIQIQPATDNKIPVAYGASYLGGTIFDIQLTNNNLSLWTAIALCETTGNLYSTGAASQIYIDAIYLDNKLITFASDGTTVDHTTDDTGVIDYRAQNDLGIYLYQGNSSSPMLPVQPGTTTPISGTVPSAAYSIMPGWNNTYMAENIVFAIVKLNYDQSKGISTIPNLKFHVVNTISLPGDCLYDYMTNDLYGASINPNLINTSSITALNTYSAQSVTYGNFPAQQRYQINGLIDTNNKVLDNMDKLAATAGSYITYDVASGQWSVLIQQVVSQTFTFSDHNIIGQVNATGTALDSYYNSVEVQFPYAYYRDQNNYIRIDLPSADLDYNEPVNVLKLQHDFINNQVQAAIVGNIILRQSREDLAVEFKTDFSSYNLQIGDVFGLTNATYGFTNRQFRVIKLVKNEDDKGELTITVTGLSYNPDVYTVDTIDQFTPLLGTSSNPNLAAIGTPIAPTVASSTISSQPSITITATVPSGVVTDMEFWASSDGVNYVFQGSTRSANSGPFTTGSTTSFKTVELQTATWYFKVRAGNQQGTSKFSPASAGLPFTYIQAPDVLPYNTPVTGGSGSSLSALSGLGLGIIAAYVASQINWQGLGSSILSSLESAGVLSPDTVSSIQGNLNKQFTGGVTSGTGINVSSGGVVSLNASIDALNDVDTTTVVPASGDYLEWNGQNWVPSSALGGMNGSGGSGGSGGSNPCFITINQYYPPDRSSLDPLLDYTTLPDNAPISGSYSIRFAPAYSALSKGTGNAYLYSSDGTLISTVSASAVTIDKNVVSIPFATRTIGVDYYILMTAGFVTQNGCLSPGITDPTVWNFHTGNANPYSVTGDPLVTPSNNCNSNSLNLIKFITETLPNVEEITPHSKVYVQSNIGLVYNEPITLQTTGTITISGQQVIDLSKTFSNAHTSNLVWVSGNTLWINPTSDFAPATTYHLTMTSNCVKDACGINGNTQISDSTTVVWTTDNGGIASAGSTGSITPTLTYDRQVLLGTGTANITTGGGTVVSSITPTSPNLSLSNQDG